MRSSTLESLALAHAGLLGLFAPWAFGGGSARAEMLICLFGSAAPLFTALALSKRRFEGRPFLPALLPLGFLAAFNGLILLSLLHPSFRATTIEGAEVLVPVHTPLFWPDCARPELAAKTLWLLDACLLPGVNLLLVVRRRQSLRLLFFVLAANAFALAVFGSLQQFVSARGIFFGAVPSPNPTFFASFVYHNHWGAFVVLALSLGLALVFSRRRDEESYTLRHSPVPAAMVGLFFTAATLPLSGSRACTLLAVLLLSAGLLHALFRVIERRRSKGRSAAAPIAGIFLGTAAALAIAFSLAKPVIYTRLADTANQLGQMQAQGGVGARSQLYRDTWAMARDRIWTGWGLGSYGTVFRSYNSLRSVDQLPQYYEHAHSDWLELTAETGLIGLGLLLAFALAALLPALRAARITATPAYLLAGCALICLYACIEFPLSNPAVAITFSLCFFGAVRWVRLEATETGN